MNPSTWPTGFFLTVIVVLLVAIGLASLPVWRRHPSTACPKCGGSGKSYQQGKGRRFYGPCRRCGGSGARTRAGVRFLNWLTGGGE